MNSAVLRAVIAWTHRWAGLAAGLLFCLMGITGAIVSFRPQIGLALGPPPSSVAQCRTVDWNDAQRELEATTGTRINRVYVPAPGDNDPRYHVRMETPVDAIYVHLFYDGCAGTLLGGANLQWLDWIVDLHHNVWAGHTGRLVVGAIGVALFLSGIGGLTLIVMSAIPLKRFFTIEARGDTRKTLFHLHRSVGAGAAALLLLQSFTGIWLCYPAMFRVAVGDPAPPRIARPSAARHGDRIAGLGDLMSAAQQAVGDGHIREIRMPDGPGGIVQVRMWRDGDFRSLGNNVVSVDRASARVLNVDLYEGKPTNDRFLQALAGLHYGEWGGILFRTIYGLFGLAVAPLFLTGAGYWWLRRRAGAAAASRAPSTVASAPSQA